MIELELEQEWVERLQAVVNSDTPIGFATYWYLVFFNPDAQIYDERFYLPNHCTEWIAEFYWALWNKKKGFALEAFRGSLKSTVFTLGLNSYRLCIYPHKEIILAQANDTSAHENTEFIASLIEHSPALHALFPNLKPDSGMGWGAKGYEVKSVEKEYGIWRKLRTKVPSLIGAGYRAKNILGKHPRLHGQLDDVATFDNTRSPRKLNELVKTIEKEIRPAFDKVDIQIDVFTPWTFGDPGYTQKNKVTVHHVRTPIYKVIDKVAVPTWPEVWPMDEIEILRGDTPPAEFAQMYMCDLEAASGDHLKKEWLSYYPHEEIDPDWPRWLAVDYASIGRDLETKNRDHFALAQVTMHPRGFAILETGKFGFFVPTDCQDIAINWGVGLGGRMRQLGVEEGGKGEEFLDIMLLQAPFRVKGLSHGNKSKASRFEKEMAPLFKAGYVKLSDKPGDPYLKQFVQEWLAFDDLDTYFDDCLDAGYYALKLIATKIKSAIMGGKDPRRSKGRKYKNPIFAGFGRK